LIIIIAAVKSEHGDRRQSPGGRSKVTVEYLVTMTTHVPGGTSGETVDGIRAGEDPAETVTGEILHLDGGQVAGH
jgi:hypothetical protein